MSVLELLATLKEKDVQLSVKGDQLVVQGNKQALKEPSVLAALREHKAELIALINAGQYRAQRAGQVDIPANRIVAGCTRITPDMLTLTTLDQAAIDLIVGQIPGGAANIQDIYPLAPLQSGILFHHLSAQQGDPYVLQCTIGMDNRQCLDDFSQALQCVIDRHDSFRTAVIWDGLDEPHQVVLRQARLQVEELVLDPAEGDIRQQLEQRFDTRHFRLDISQAPLIRIAYAHDPQNGRWLALLMLHHIISDHAALAVVQHEIQQYLLGHAAQLGKPVPYRNYVAQARLGVTEQQHEAFFRDMLGEVDEPTLPFGLADVQGDGNALEEAVLAVAPTLGQRLRAQARQQGVSTASLCHLAWAQVLAAVTGKQRVVFGTVFLGRMEAGEGAEHALGMLINTLPLRVDIGEQGAQAALKATHARLSALLGHEHAPLVLAQRCSGVAAPQPLFSALLNYRHSAAAQAGDEAEKAWRGIEFFHTEERTNYPLTLSVDEFSDGFSFTVQALPVLGAQRFCGYMHAALEHLLQALEQNPQAAVNQLPVLPDAERQQVLAGFNQTHADYPRGLTIHQRIEQQAERSPEALAAVYDGQTLTYAELNRQANHLAYRLIELGVQPDDRVAICARRSLETLVGLVAILKAGAAYVPVDPAHPLDRIGYLLEDSAPLVVLVQPGLSERLPAMSVPVLELDPLLLAGPARANPQIAGLTPAHLAYVIYTSGSTGLPKGVMVEHQTLDNLVNWHCEAFNLSAGSHTSSVAGFGFDAMAWEVWPALCVGATLHLPPAAQGNEDIDALLTWWLAQPLDVSFLPTPVAEYAFSQNLQHPTLKTLLIGGDRLRQFTQAQRFTLVNNYGPTEATVVATSGVIEAGQTLHIGKPVANAQVYVLDAQLKPVPLGVAGELYVGGAGVARGYLNRAQMTAERFLKDPFSSDPQARMYRTGDLVRWLADGTLDYLGRNDDQVKIRGVRIELGEIETCLGGHPAVREAVVIARDGRLIAYFTAGEALDIEHLRHYLQAQLPDAMVPAAYMHLDNLPLTANGKLDRKALPEPDQSAQPSRDYVAPVGEVEIALAQIWAEVLKVERVGRHDHFFELGGHSLLAVGLISRMRQAGLQADVRVLFSQPTLAALAAAVGHSREVTVEPNRIQPGCTRITPDLLTLVNLDQASLDRIVDSVPGGVANVQDIYPLAPLQEGILYHHLSAERGDPYLLQARFSFADEQRLQAFTQALQRVIDRHDILRTAIVLEGLPAPVQVVWRKAELAVQQVLLEETGGDVMAQLEQRFGARQHRLDLARAPLMQLVYAQDPARQRVAAILLFHHIALDHTALEVVSQEMQAYLSNPDAQLPEAVPYRNYVAQARLGVSEQEHEAFFCELLGDIDTPTLPFGLQDVQGDARDIEEAHLVVDAELDRRLRGQLRQLGVSAASLFHLAWAQVLAAATGQQNVVFGTVLMGRMLGGEGAERALGMFINTLPLRLDIDQRDARAGVRQAHGRLSALLGHEHASLALAQRCSQVNAPLPLFSALLNYRHSAVAEGSEQVQQAWQGMEGLGGEERTNYPLTLNVDEWGDGFSLTVLTLAQVGAQRVCGFVHQALEQLVQALEQSSTTALQALTILPAAERQQVLQTFNATTRAYPAALTVHGVFEALVAAQPQALAAVQDGQRLTYGELNSRANRLAHHLLGLGAAPGDRVAILLERSLDLLVAQLAISKCAAVYVPLDVNAPADRQAFMIEDSGARWVLTTRATEVAGHRLDLDTLDLGDHPEHNPPLEQSSETAAYIMYTSGSTGTPKGVLVPHRAITRLVINNGYAEFNPQDRVAFASNPAFDASTLDVWAPLLNGGAVVVVDQDTLLSREAFAALLQEQSISVLWMTAGLFHQYAEGLLPVFPQLRYLIVGGDVLDPSVIARVLKDGAPQHLLNGYGPTEATTFSTTYEIQRADEGSIPIGKPVGNSRAYVLDARQQPVPVGVAGELYIGGQGVALGYLNRADLTAHAFLVDPFNDGGLMYRTGDLVAWRADGTLQYLGRNDQQVKIRGFRIELGEIEARLSEHPQVKDVVVLARQDEPGHKRLVAYFTERENVNIEALRDHLHGQLPDYMVPAAYVRLDSLPLTNNGKVDRKALPAPDQDALLSRGYEAPQGEIETLLAQIWADVLKVEQVGRHDNFFELGGHSLLAVSLIERMRQANLSADVRVLFRQPTLAALAAAVGSGREVAVPANLITPDCERITPALLPLARLSQAGIDRIVATVPGGVANVQDIYPLAPLQEGVLYHHIRTDEGDPYLLQSSYGFDNLERFQVFADVLQAVIDRHDILRTGLVWEGLESPMQVVWRKARLVVQEVVCDPAAGEVLAQLRERFDARHYRLDLTQAPLMRMVYAQDPANRRVVAVLMFHHLVMDHTALDTVQQEMRKILLGHGEALGHAVPYRNYVAQARLGSSEAEHEAFFCEMLGDIDEPTLPFGLQDVQGEGHGVGEATHLLDLDLSLRLREQARQAGVSAASLFHLAWARVLGTLSGRQNVVFGTVLLGRMQGGEGADRALGMFINTLPLRVDVAQDSVRAAVKSTHVRLTALLGHEHASLALAQRCSGVAATTPLFSALLNYRHSAGVEDAVEMDQAWHGMYLLHAEERTNYPITLSVDDLGEQFNLSALVVSPIEARRICDYLLTAVTHLVQALEQTPQLPLEQVRVLPLDETRQVLEAFNATARAYPNGQTVHDLFQQRAAATPQAVAAVQGAVSLSYAQLNARANKLAHHLLSLGAAPGERVAILLERSLDLLVAQLAISKCAAVYVPLDVNAPTDRQAFMIEDSGARWVLTTSATEVTGHRLDLDSLDLSAESEHNPNLEQSSETAAYIMYTSGSTGTPKGVLVPHRAITRLVINNGYAEFNPQDRVAFASNPAFDASTLDVWAPLLNGGAVVVVDQDTLLSREAFAALLQEQSISVLWMTAGLFHQYAEGLLPVFPQLRYLIVGGDVLDPSVIARVLKDGAPQHLLNGYGPTEATTFSTTYEIQRADEGSIPIGKPVGNSRAYVLDARQQPVPVGVAGELYIGGQGVALGYLNRTDLTAHAFLVDPFNDGGLMYRTGDLVAWRADGTLQYLGRNDQQVKIRGFRIELGEIEARLGEHPQVKDVVVLARQDESGHKRLVAYFTERSRVEIEALRDYLHDQLPDYMVPAAYVRLDSLPLTNNGKVDRKALPAPDQDALLSRGYEAPQGEIETLLAQIWAEVLKVEQVGRHDNFFELGGHSLLAVSLIERMRQANLSADVRVLFSQPTLAALAAAVDNGRMTAAPANRISLGCEHISPDMLPLADLDQVGIDRVVAGVPGGVANVQDIYALAPLQEGLLYHHVTASHGDPYQQHALFAFDSRERLDAFAQALQAVIARHDILRTALVWDGLETPVQVVWREAPLGLTSLRVDEDGDVAAQVREQLDPSRFPLDLRRAPMMHLGVAHDPRQQRWIGMLVFHHLVNDAASLGVLTAEIEAHMLDQQHRLPASVPYRNYVAQTRQGKDRAAHEAFFSDMLGDFDQPTLAFGLLETMDAASSEQVLGSVPATLGMRIRAQARLAGVSAASLYHLAWAQILGAVSGQDDVVFGTVLLGRLQAGEGADRALGMFINTLPLRVKMAGLQVKAALKQTHAGLSALLAHEHAPLSLAQRCSAVAAPTPLFNSLLNYRHVTAGGEHSQQAWEGIVGLESDSIVSYPLVLEVDDLGSEFRLTARAPRAIGAQRLLDYLLISLDNLANALEMAPRAALAQLSVLPVAEREALLGFNATDAAYPRDSTVVQLIEAQAARTPGAIALVLGDRQLSYRDLNEQANRVAHYLRSLGAGADRCVAICMPRSLELIVGLLGILKSGAAYVPLDPEYPAQRLAFALQDSQPLAVLVQDASRGVLGDTAIPLVDLADAALAEQPLDNPPALATANDLAYVIFTSGSTGRPKGVMVEHGSLVNHIGWQTRAFGFDATDRFLQRTSVAFDASVWEIWTPLAIGARLVLLPAEASRDVEHMARTLVEQGVTIAQFVPSLLRLLVQLPETGVRCRYLFSGGEALDPQLAMQARALTSHGIVNLYGPTEATIDSTSWTFNDAGPLDVVPIGKPIANARAYVLDAHLQLLPLGVAGELYIGGAGVARGYLGRDDLTAERFLADPFNPGGRLYKTGDLVRYLADGNIEYLGRNDDQIKLRGLRIELGEIESCLAAHAQVEEAVVLVRNERLIAYCRAPASLDLEALRAQAQAQLPSYMVPQAYVLLDALPLSPNGKVDRQALPDPDGASVLVREYEAPLGETEITLAQLWCELLEVEQVGRHDNFFELGGHSLLMVNLMGRMRAAGLQADVRTLFDQPTLAALAASVGAGEEQAVPANLIPADCTRITPSMLPLATLDQASIERIVATVSGGAANVQDIYPLAPLQEGILYHHLSAVHGDPYVMQLRYAFEHIERLHAFSAALQQVIERHDILRTGVVWEGLQQPMQVVWRTARLSVEPGSPEILQPRLDLTQAPMMQLLYAEEASDGRVVATLLFHHMILDHVAMEVVQQEMQAFLMDETAQLQAPVPYRNYVAQTRLGQSEQAHERFFREQLADIEEPTLAFGLQGIADDEPVEEAYVPLDAGLSRRLRVQTRQLGVSAASLFHLAWAQVLGVVSSTERVVFGTVLMGRMQGGDGAERALGMFINTLPLRVDLGGVGVQAALKATHARLNGLLAHEHASLALAQRCSSVAQSTALFSALLNYRHSHGAPVSAAQAEAWQGMQLLQAQEHSNYPLTLSVNDQGQAFSLSALVVASVGAQRICDYVVAVVERLVQALEHAADTPMHQLSILPAHERQQLLSGFNATRIDFPVGHTLHQRFETQVELYPHALAVVYQGQSLTYSELNRQANQLAHQLLDLGVQPDDRVAICTRRSLEMLVGLVAILKAGACYVPIDPAHPAERLSYLLEDSAPVAVLIQPALAQRLPTVTAPVLELDSRLWQGPSKGNPQVKGLTPAHLAYVIYTSGSTGLPKGVMVEHQTLENLVNWHCDAFELRHGSHTSSVAGFGFDAMAWEVWPALCVGATLHLPPAREGGEDIDALLQWWLAQPLDVSFLPTPVAEYAFSQALQHPTLKTLLVGGDRLRQFHTPQRCKLVNNYGPTEATVVATSGVVEAGQTLHIGRPVANTQVYLLDAQQQPVPVGVAGELYVAGAGVARGYLNREQMTAERFLKDPFSHDPQARMYRTGDLARWLPDGTLDYLGRNDDQVKIRGVRIELGEIETRLGEHAQVREAVVLAREARLVAYFTETQAVSIEDLRRWLQAQLPEYMVPSAYVRLDHMPLTANGKLDRRALPEPGLDALISRGYEAPEGDVETTLAQIWAEVLKLEQVGRHDNFFELGGHSLLAVGLVERMRQAGLQADVRVLFSQPTLAALAASVGAGHEVAVPRNRIEPGCTHITPDLLPLATLDQASIERIVASVPGGVANVQDIYALAPLQEGLLYHHISAEQGDPYQQHALFAFDSRQRLEGFAQALQRVIARHDILRTGLFWAQLEAPVQVVWREAPLTVEEFVPQAGEVLAQLREHFSLGRHRMDIRQAPMMHLGFAHDPQHQRWIGMLSFHHLVNDATSMGVLVAEIEAHMSGREAQLGASVPYRNYVAQAMQGKDRAAHEAFFAEMLGDVDEPTLPFGVQRIDSERDPSEEAEHWLGAAFSQRLRQQARQLGVSAASLYHWAWAQVVGTLSARDDVVFGTVLLGRLQAGEGADRSLGMFINTLPLRVRLSDDSVSAAVKRTHAALSQLLAHEHASLTLAQRCSGVAAPAPLFSALLNYRHGSASVSDASRAAWEGIEMIGGEGVDSYPLILSVDDVDEDFRVNALAPRSVGAQRVLGYMTTVLGDLLDALEQAPHAAFQHSSILPAEERRHVLHGFNATARDYPASTPVHQVFESWAQAQPQAVAAVHGEQQLSYAQLNARANRLAHHLASLGMAAGSSVAVLLERSIDLLVSQLALSKCALVYVPLDVNAPVERQAFMLSDSQATLLLSHAGLGKALQVQRLDLDQTHLRHLSDDNPALVVSSEAAAYIMYTSGSTGTPKGVRVPHRAITRLVINNGYADFNQHDRVAFASNPAFDASTLEVWAPLLNGGAVVVIDQDRLLAQQQFAALLQQQAVSVLWMTAGLFHQYAEGLLEAFARLRYLIVGGDVLDPSVIARVLKGGAPQHLLNGYGPTEATTFSTTHEITRADEGSIPIGKPVGNSRAYVLDAHQQPVPVGVTGELYVGGQGVALGYLNRAELTAEKFLADPFSDGGLMYRSGDLVAWRADGTLQYQGRNDQQVKIRGFRIELGEIETRLAGCPGVKDAVVLARQDEPGHKRLVAYFTERESLDIEALRARLQGQLPEYMVPAAYVRLDSLPLTGNGKVDRKALPAPDQEALLSRAYEAPQGPVEVALAQLWQTLLKVEQVGRHDHFFELGGHSLLAVSLVEQMRKQGLDADLRVLLAQPTLAAMAAAVGQVEHVVVPQSSVPTLERKRRI
ncbi:non-ribosomal peptide synthetase [Pseudomonas sp. TKO26]|uniref:non-ribosomal peptide synthetase n=1 Tax=unclassified Pseudomonas TaxID=196821 RepID=UPI000D9D943C|nr:MULTISPECIES: non-ribosomal peptide synthetase [unclassified Pseudomonas]PYY81922.1 non-ribosomal peptide synthetase [Pseudomonas sp. TKO30]PYY83445.1 non-ribosomal peptide synthetase [Pseudomonas sp. TKO29]PYY85189.1 non-ribosomal peptide synthetase [Pseudomonas sp. TKO26]PYY97838.1 non-ribosomal peptide synthetase [Pseudomonas sp. TKO14]